MIKVKIDTILIFCVMVFLVSLPPQIYGDYRNYFSIFQDYRESSICNTSITFCILIELFSNDLNFGFDNAYRLYVSIGMSVMLYVLNKLDIRFSVYIFFMAICGIYIQLVLIRFGIAVSLAYLMVYSLQKNQLFRAAVLAGMAVCFHTSIVIFIGFCCFVYFINRFSEYRYALMLLLIPLMLLGFRELNSLYEVYLGWDTGQISIALVSLVLMTTFIALLSLYGQDSIRLDMERVYEYFSLLAVFALVVFSQNSLVASRLVYVFAIGLPFILNRIYLMVTQKDRVLLNNVAVLGLTNLYFANYWSLEY